MADIIYYSQSEFERDIKILSLKINSDHYTSIYPIPRGGIPVAIALSEKLNLPLTDVTKKGTLVVDDLVDSGRTREKYLDYDFACIHVKSNAKLQPEFYVDKKDGWIEYWWEKMSGETPVQDAIMRIIEYIGDDPNRQGLIETPKRVIRSFDELYAGYKQDPNDLLKTFDSDGYDQLVLIKDIELYSMCEHHVLPFIGRAHVGYIPKGKVIGVSKIARVVDLYSRRLQIQERLSEQIASCIEKWLNPAGVACVIEAVHFCMRMRGVSKQNSTMVTSSLKGVFLEDSEKGRAARTEFMGLIK